MPIREVLRYPHPDLKRRCEPVGDGPGAQRVAADLVDTMRANERCVGLAAPQIGELVRVVVVDVSGHPKGADADGLLVLCDPAVVHAAGSELGREGCLSIPDLTANVRRATAVRVEARSPHGEPVVVNARGFEARALLHELDHLDGVLFLDRVATSADLFPRRDHGARAGTA